MQQTNWKENVILIDANYLDEVVLDLIVNLEPMIGRSIPNADLCQWLDCIALDGGIRPGENEIQVLFIHDKTKTSLKYFKPSSFEEELDAKAFKDSVGEFQMASFPSEDVVTKDQLFLESLQTLINSVDIKNLMIVGDDLKYGDVARNYFKDARQKDLTYFSMEPVKGGRFFQEILGYSLMSALGINAEEV